MRYLIFLLLITGISCTKKDEVTTDNKTIVGKWKLTERYSDIGNGTGSWQAVPSTESIIIIFGADGNFGASGYRDFSAYNRYELLAPNEIKLYDDSGVSFIIRYTLNNQLTLSFPCRERCSDRFIGIN